MRSPEDVGQIEMNPAVLVGKPVIKGTRISVQLVLEHLASGQTVDEFLESYAHIAREDVLAALEYASVVLGNMRSEHAGLAHDRDIESWFGTTPDASPGAGV
ncbi:MAG: DUF433 domain-containing protein [Armatimonadetes bacterium]|nr:DUF433 domain-containing protein [Armatimonadota bacterium]